MKQLFVIDTNCLIRYFHVLFHQTVLLSAEATSILDAAFSGSPEILISVPSIVFVEIYAKWLNNEEFAKAFYYEVFFKITESPNFEIRPIDDEVMEHLVQLDGVMIGHDLHDKIILASAMVLECPLISTDTHIRNYVATSDVIPRVIH
ncbi:MAG: hypothetical protein NT023_11835 [Armatimonadetes bacterium]|nr:hypothetical protein [Armatimonadota bacterium]